MVDRASLEDRRRILRTREYHLELAASIASGMGEYALANSIWAVTAKLKAERVAINTRLCKLDNPNYPAKKS